MGQTIEINFQLTEAGPAGVAGELAQADAGESEALQRTFDAGVAAAAVDSHDEAIARFTEALEIMPACYQCYFNIGVEHGKQRQDEAAEAAFRQAVAIKSDYADAYDGLAGAVFNQALTLWNASKFDEARIKLRDTIASDATHSEAHFWLAMASVNAGDIEEASTLLARYLELDPDGQYAGQASGILDQVNPL